MNKKKEISQNYFFFITIKVKKTFNKNFKIHRSYIQTYNNMFSSKLI